MLENQIKWFHSHDFGNGETVNGIKSIQKMRAEAEVIFSEPVSGKSVLDIGAWDGYFSFEAERRGASDVLATDHFCWSGPGWGNKDGFDYAHDKFKSRVRSLDADVFALDPQTVGTFDVVLFLGVLYHLENPFAGLKQISALTQSYAVIETVVAELHNPRAVMRYYIKDELENDPTNFFAPNYKCLENMLRDVGFSKFKFSVVEYTAELLSRKTAWLLPFIDFRDKYFRPDKHSRVVVHAWK